MKKNNNLNIHNGEYFIMYIKPFTEEHFKIAKKYNFKEDKYNKNYSKITNSKKEVEKLYKEFLCSNIGYNFISSREFKN